MRRVFAEPWRLVDSLQPSHFLVCGTCGCDPLRKASAVEVGAAAVTLWDPSMNLFGVSFGNMADICQTFGTMQFQTTETFKFAI